MVSRIFGGRLRCRAFFGRELSLVGRQGGYFMPFFDREIVEEALTLPMALKNLGRFEAALLTRLDPSLASRPSAYGHAFDQPPSREHVMSEMSTRSRPIWSSSPRGSSPPSVFWRTPASAACKAC